MGQDSGGRSTGGGEWTRCIVDELKSPVPNALATGPFGSAISSRYFTEHGIPVIRGSNLSKDVGTRLNDDGLVFVSEGKAKEFSRSLAKPGDLVFTCWGTIDQVGLIDDRSLFQEYVISNKQMKLTPDTRKTDSLFLYYLFSSPSVRNKILNQGIGSSVPGFNLGQLRSMTLTLPPLSEQRAIARILGTLDDKIELNRRMNETLEEMARTLFKSWFVDFDPVHAKAALRNHTANRSPLDWSAERARAYLDGMDPSIAALFPDGFVDSELGEMPEGWEVEQFADHISATRGLSYKGTGLCGDNEGLPMHNLNSIFEGGSYKYDGIKYYKGEYREKHLLKPGDLIVTNTEQGFDRLLIGYAAIVPESFGPVGLYSHHIYRIDIKSKSLLTPQYLVHLFNSPFYHQWISGFANGTTINMLPMDALEIPLLVIPPSELIKAFTILAQNIHAQFQSNLGQSHTLTTLRDTLLPRLISGELRVGDSRRFLESVS